MLPVREWVDNQRIYSMKGSRETTHQKITPPEKKWQMKIFPQKIPPGWSDLMINVSHDDFLLLRTLTWLIPVVSSQMLKKKSLHQPLIYFTLACLVGSLKNGIVSCFVFFSLGLISYRRNYPKVSFDSFLGLRIVRKVNSSTVFV